MNNRINQKGFANTVLIVVIVAIMAVGGYFIVVKKPAQQSNIDNCSSISNSSFRSTNRYEVGLGPNGVVMGYWEITLQGGKLQWAHSDVGESGTYTCSNNILQVKFFDHSITAYYDGSKKILTWDGVEYKKVE